ncbi:DoxX family membrane protein [Marivirga arenosa]|uniref:DoxX family membrane protein n=1 Tax=Marivirga arenosa TaxID=3059076 RepID=A0AA49GI94_9BACT|nr:DoxX family membrane protein [Marivirga sp. ABR2-2]WKK85080.2 DoxX family membrane protein [Marivirga sp. ABR2-2]
MGKFISIFFIIVQLGLGSLFVYAGVRKFIPSPDRKSSNTEIVKGSTKDQMIQFITGLKANTYFWPFLGVVEIIAGLLLVSQFFAVGGAILLTPITLNIFLFHIFLKPDDVTGGIMSGLYLLGSILIILRKHKTITNLIYTKKPFQL